MNMSVLARSAVLVLALALAGCLGKDSPPPVTVTAACDIVHTPEFQIKGKTAHDDDWIDDTTERLVRGCNQPRPKLRPKAWDGPIHIVAGKPVPILVPAKQKAAAPKKATFRERFWPKK